jgi:hypothetical protein
MWPPASFETRPSAAPQDEGGLIALSRRSVDFFMRAAKPRRVPYQRMIRALVDAYADKQAGK